MTPVLEEAIRLLDQSRRDLAALLGEAPGAASTHAPRLFETLLDVAEVSARHELALEEIRSRLDEMERA